MSKSYGKKNNKIWNVLLCVISFILVVSCIGLLYNHFEDDIQLLFKDEIQVIEGIDAELKESEIASAEAYHYGSNPYCYTDLDLYENIRLTKIGIPVKTLNDCKKDQVFTLYVVEGDGKSSFKEIEKYELVIEANTYESNTVNKWHYFDVKDLKIEVGEGQTLAFTAKGDTVIPGFKKSYVKYNFYSNPFNNVTLCADSSILIDVYGYKLDK